MENINFNMLFELSTTLKIYLTSICHKFQHLERQQYQKDTLAPHERLKIVRELLTALDNNFSSSVDTGNH